MDYRQAVAQGRVLVARPEQDQWDLAQLTYEVLVVEKIATLRQWAADLKVSKTHVETLRNVWARYGVQSTGQRSKRTFNEWYTLAMVSTERADELIEKADRRGRSVTTVHKERHRSRLEDYRDWFLHDKAARREFLKDKEVRNLIDRELPARRPNHERPKGKDHPRPAPAGYQAALDAIRAQLNSLLSMMLDEKLPKSVRKSIHDSIQALRDTLDWMDGYVETNDRSFEDALDHLMAEEGDAEVVDITDHRRPPADPAPDPATDVEPSGPRHKPDREERASRTGDGARRSGRDRRREHAAPGL